MQKQDFFSKQQSYISQTGFTGGIIRQQKKSNTHSAKWRILILIILGILGSLIYFYKDSIINQEVTIESENESGFDIGSQIQLTGFLIADGDILNYSHTLKTYGGDIFFLKSKIIPLNNYSNTTGEYVVIGTIELGLFNGTAPLIEVISIQQINNEGDTEDDSLQIQEDTNQGLYINQAGLGFSQDFLDNYTFIGNPGDNGEITIKNIDNEKQTTIKFFTCTDSGDSNCKQLTKTFSENATRKLINANGDTYYKLPDIQSRYFQNENWRGYFINNADDTEVENLKDQIIISNEKTITNIVSRYGVKTCLGEDKGNYIISSHKTQKTNNGIIITIEGTGDKIFSCETKLDLSLPNQMEFIDIQIKQEGTLEGTSDTNSGIAHTENIQTETNNTINNLKTPSVKQFPINLEKAMKYSSKRGEFTMTLPSGNLAYSTEISDEDFGQVGVNCSYATKVIKYSEKENLKTNPSVIIYECKVKNGLTLPGDNFYSKEFEGKTFIIEILNPERYDFAKNISISSL